MSKIQHLLEVLMWFIMCIKGTGMIHFAQGIIMHKEYAEVIESKTVPPVQ